MQRGWERRYPFLQLTQDAIAQRVQAAFPHAVVVAAEPLTSGLRNTNYRIQLQDQEAPLVLRLYTADPSACRREHALANLLHARVPLPTVFYVDPVADPPF